MAEQLHIVVVVLGDVGRSPRMQYHALSLLELGHYVTLVGYDGEDLIEDLQVETERFSAVRFGVPECPIILRIIGLRLLWRILMVSLWLFHALFFRLRKKPQVECIVVQNPPAVPLMTIAWLFSKVKGMTQSKRPKFIIDWHNLQYSFFGGILQKLVKAYEVKMSRFAHGHLCVTAAMKSFLQKEMGLSDKIISVLYDCPPSMFRPLTVAEQHHVLTKLKKEFSNVCPRSWNLPEDASQDTILTKKSSETEYEPRYGRPALLTSSTSWTPDEDFGLLLDALVMLEEQINLAASPLKILLVVTGKGPEKAMYEEKISQLKMASVAVHTIWLDPGDYPKLLACADLGISLHTSTSGLDLPMKVLDLYGCQVPVCARDFECLCELVKDKENGRTFSTASQLADQLWTLLSPLTRQPNAAPHSFGELNLYSKNLEGRRRWKENWTENAMPIILSSSFDVGEDDVETDVPYSNTAVMS